MSSLENSSNYLQQMTSFLGQVAGYMRLPVLISSVLLHFSLDFLAAAAYVIVLTLASGHSCYVELVAVFQAKVRLSFPCPLSQSSNPAPEP